MYDLISYFIAHIFYLFFSFFYFLLSLEHFKPLMKNFRRSKRKKGKNLKGSSHVSCLLFLISNGKIQAEQIIYCLTSKYEMQNFFFPLCPNYLLSCSKFYMSFLPNISLAHSISDHYWQILDNFFSREFLPYSYISMVEFKFKT